ncbi:MAG: hypothetical protein JXA50_01700 [Deltaproteobacteria bacterium]|nr:hypothetical protein [Deltaproteobacteria bacterium]
MTEIQLYLPKVPMRSRLLVKGRTWRAQWAKKKREQQDWQLLIRSKIGAQKPEKPLSGVVIETTIYRRDEERDADNLLYACKALWDALKAEGIIFDDSSRHVAIKIPKQIKVTRADEEMTIVVIKERI